MSASVLVVTPSPLRAAFHVLCEALWVRFAAAFLTLRASLEAAPSSVRLARTEAEELVPPTLRSPGSIRA